MKPAEAYADLVAMERPILTTREAAARWRDSESSASRRLGALERAGLVRRLRKGLWAIDKNLQPFTIAPFLTAPYPAYVSLFSALREHGMIEQIPRQISVVSLGRAKAVTTAAGRFEIHQLVPELFGGYGGEERSGYVAEPEKALFDLVYLRAAAGSEAHPPELTLGRSFRRAELKRWTERIESARLRTLVWRRLREVLGGAV